MAPVQVTKSKTPLNNSTDSESAIANTVLFHFRVVFQEILWHFRSLALFVRELFIFNKNILIAKAINKKNGAHSSLKVWAVPLGIVYPRVPFLDILPHFLTSWQQHVKPSSSRTRLMQLF